MGLEFRHDDYKTGGRFGRTAKENLLVFFRWGGAAGLRVAGCRRVMGINILRQHVQAVFRVAMSITRRKEVAEDLTSEAFLALHREMASIDPSQLPAWLLTVVRNRARNLWRHQVIEERYAVETKPAAPPKALPASSLEEWILASPGLKPVHRLCVMRATCQA